MTSTNASKAGPTADEPLELTAVVGQPAAAPHAATAAATGGGHSIGSVLARLDAREAALGEDRQRSPMVSNRPLDQVVEDALRPILADWLDRNLERIVRDQVDLALQAEVAARERARTSEGR